MGINSKIQRAADRRKANESKSDSASIASPFSAPFAPLAVNNSDSRQANQSDCLANISESPMPYHTLGLSVTFVGSNEIGWDIKINQNPRFYTENADRSLKKNAMGYLGHSKIMVIDE